MKSIFPLSYDESEHNKRKQTDSVKKKLSQNLLDIEYLLQSVAKGNLKHIPKEKEIYFLMKNEVEILDRLLEQLYLGVDYIKLQYETRKNPYKVWLTHFEMASWLEGLPNKIEMYEEIEAHNYEKWYKKITYCLQFSKENEGDIHTNRKLLKLACLFKAMDYCTNRINWDVYHLNVSYREQSKIELEKMLEKAVIYNLQEMKVFQGIKKKLAQNL